MPARTQKGNKAAGRNMRAPKVKKKARKGSTKLPNSSRARRY